MKALLMAAIAAILATVGCDEATPTDDGASALTSIQIAPADNALDVATSSGVILTFRQPVNRSIVEKNFRLMNERSYPDSLCPVSSVMGHGSMGSSMMDMQKMAHLDSLHGLRGAFSWNSDSTVCTFRPDSLLLPAMQHMVHVRQEMVDMVEGRMGSMGMMGRTGMGSGTGMAFHFVTATAAGPGIDHDGHHGEIAR